MRNHGVAGTDCQTCCIVFIVEQYDQAISDLTQCLQIQKQILVPEDRRLAETLYQLGLACTYCRQYDSAVEYYRSAIAVIQSKINRLVRIVTGEIPPDPVENSDGFYTPLELAQKEIEELRELLPDIAAKVNLASSYTTVYFVYEMGVIYGFRQWG